MRLNVGLKRVISKNKDLILVLIISYAYWLLLLAYHLHWNLDNNLFAGGDMDPILGISKGWALTRYIWAEEVFGFPYMFFYYFPYLLILSFFYIISFGNIVLAHNLFIVFLLSLIPFSAYLISKKITNSVFVSVLAVLFYMSLPQVIERAHIFEYHTIILYSLPILMIYVSMEYFKNKERYLITSYLVVLALLSLFLMRLTIAGLIFVIFSMIIAYILEIERVSLKSFSKRAIVAVMFILLLWIPFIIEQQISESYVISKSSFLREFNERYVRDYMTMLQLIDVLQGLSQQAFWFYKNRIRDELPGEIYFKGYMLLKENFLFILYSIYPILILLILLLLCRRNKKLASSISQFKVLFLFSTVLMVYGANILFFKYGELILEKGGLASLVFRSVPKYSMYVLSPLYLIIFVLLLQDISQIFNLIRYKILFRKMAIGVMMTLMVMGFYVQNYGGSPFHKYTVVNIPNELFEISNLINTDKHYGKVLLVPFTTFPFGYEYTTFGYFGPPLLHWTLKRAVIDKHWMMLPDDHIKILKMLEENSDFDNILERLNIKYIVLRKNLDNSIPYLKPVFDVKRYEIMLEAKPYLKKIYNGQYYNIYLDVRQENTPMSMMFTYPSNLNEKVSNISGTFLYQTYSFNYTNITNFELYIRYKLLPKKEYGDWKLDNHCIIDSDLIKISVEPHGNTFVFLKYYSKNNSLVFNPYVFSFPYNKFNPTEIRVRYNNGEFHVYINGILFVNKTLSLNENKLRLSNFVIGKNIDGYEEFRGDIDALIFSINNNTILAKEHSNDLSFAAVPETNILKLNPTLWKVKVNATKPFMLTFAESYDPLWEARVYKDGKLVEKVSPVPVYGVINGFWINQTGELEIILRYTPQDWFERGLIISLTTFILSIFYITYDWRREKGDRWAKRLEEKFKRIAENVKNKIFRR